MLGGQMIIDVECNLQQVYPNSKSASKMILFSIWNVSILVNIALACEIKLATAYFLTKNFRTMIVQLYGDILFICAAFIAES